MARPDTVPPPPCQSHADAAIPMPPAAGAARVRWFEQLDDVISVDILAQRLHLRDLGLPPAAVEVEMTGYREWLCARIGAVCDVFAAEVAWAAS